MFTDGRSRRVIFVAHCILNQNAISDGTAVCPCADTEVIRALLDARAGIVQMPCPEVCCLGLDRGDPLGAERPVTVENTRIRRAMQAPSAQARLKALTELVVLQIAEYHRHGFEVLGVVGVNRSPCCGVESTSDHDCEVAGRGVFIAALDRALAAENLAVPVIGVRPGTDAAAQVQALLSRPARTQRSSEDRSSPGL